MGADIYLGSEWGAAGRYRDSYGPWTTLNALGLSWWQDVLPDVGADGRYNPDKLPGLIDLIVARWQERLDGPGAVEYARAHLAGQGIDISEERAAATVSAWLIDTDRLLTVLIRGRDEGLPVYMSL